MSQPIVPLTVTKLRRFEKKSRNEILMKIRLEKVELIFFHSISQEVLETILDKVLFSMTIRLCNLGQVYLVCGKTDMRQGIDSLAYFVKSQFNLDLFSGQVYLFCGGRKDRFKALYWDGQGFECPRIALFQRQTGSYQ